MADHQQETEKEQHYISKSQLKRDMNALQQLGAELSELPKSILQGFDLDNDLFEALLFAKTIKSNSAKRRHMQYIGKLMRNIDVEPIKQSYETYQHQLRNQKKAFHALEKSRDELLAGGDPAINVLVEKYPHLDRSHLRQLIRNAAKEKERQKPPKSARLLFQYLKENLNP